MKTLVWRLESKESGCGIYRDNALFDVSNVWTCNTDGTIRDDKKHPLPSDIWPRWNTECNQWMYYFGFISIQSLYDWVDDEHWRRALYAAGAVLVVYEVDLQERHFKSDTQIAFNRQKSILLETFEDGEWVNEESFMSMYEELMAA